MDYWPEKYLNNKVTVTGKLVQKRYPSNTKVDEGGVIRESAGELQYVLEKPQVLK